ncbi:hypothetical protein [Hymenobacter sp.]|uniref:hypothetical protein n=1 Tax=Hymenobacter sp. TaxID=1898978 RepID=UPI00286CDC00|nr:hypothetical protein [Hymenobacter sp.]
MRVLDSPAGRTVGHWAAPGALLSLLLALSGWFYHDSIRLYPSFFHAWAQADWLAIALQFRARGYDFFHPATFNLLTDDGVTAAGFPAPAYLTALLMGLTGSAAPGLMRGVTLAAGLGGVLALFGLVRRASGSALKGGVAALFAFSSPIYGYYQANFLPSAPAIAAVLAGYYWFWRALEEPAAAPAAVRRRLVVAVAWLALAAAMRTPYALPLLCTLGHLVLRPRRTAATVGWRAVAAVYGGAFGLLILDFSYNEHLTRTHHGAMFRARPLPFSSWAEAVQVTKVVREYWLFRLLSKPQWLLLLLAAGAVLGQQGRRLLRSEWAGHWLALAGGGLVYYGLMGPQYGIHDYYLLDTFFLPLVLGFGGSVAAVRLARPRAAWLAAGAAALLSAGAAWQARAEQVRRISVPATDQNVVARDNFLGSARWLDSLGVPRRATLLVLDAHSYNLPLLLAQRRGWTVLQNTPANLRAGLARPADYVITQNATYAAEVVNNYPAIAACLRPVAANGRLTLWRIRPVSLVARWRLRTDFEASLDPARWAGTASVSAGLAASGRRAVRLAGNERSGLTYHQTAAELGLRAGEQLLLAARHQTSPDAGAELVASLTPGAGGAPYWRRVVPCRPSRPGDWEAVGGALTLPAIHAPDDVLRVGIRRSGPGAAVLDDWEMSLLPR